MSEKIYSSSRRKGALGGVAGIIGGASAIYYVVIIATGITNIQSAIFGIIFIGFMGMTGISVFVIGIRALFESLFSKDKDKVEFWEQESRGFSDDLL